MKKLFTLWLALLFGLVANAQTKFVKSVPTLTELRALNVADIHTNVLVNSYWTSNTNSVGALFQWVPGATDATNTTSVFAPASGTGRWIRVELPANPGSATQPGFRFLGDDNTGIYNSGADAIDFSTGGSRRWGITSAGILQSQGAQTISSSSSTLTLQPVGSLIVSPNSSEAMRVLTTGAVGIGTTGPDKKLDVLDASNAQLRLSQADGTVYTDIGTISAGHTLITNSFGTRITSTTVNDTSVLARQVQGGLAFDGVTASSGVTHTISASAITGDNTVSATFQCPSSNPSVIAGIWNFGSSSTTWNTTNSYFCYISTDGKLYVQRTSAVSAGQNIYDYIANFVTLYAGKVVTVTAVNVIGTPSMTVYVNGVAAATVSVSTGASVPTWALPFNASYALIGKISSTELFNNPIFSTTLFNRALSASEVITLANQGVSEADKWGSLTAKIGGTTNNGNFEAGAGTTFTSWTANSGITVAEETVDMHSGTRCPKITGGGTLGSSGNNWFSCNSNSDGPLVYGKRYRYSVWLKRVSGTDSAQLGTGYTEFAAITNAGAWQEYTGSFVANSTITTSSDVLTFGAASGSVWLIDDVTITQIGSILDADLSAGVGYQVPDRSSNKYHGVVSATGTAWTLAQRRGQLRYTTTGAATGAFQLLSSTAIPTNALIQSIVAWSAGTPLVYVGTATGTSNIVGHTTLVGSTYTPLTLSSQFSTTGNLWLNKSATNEVNLTVNYMIADP